MLPEVQKVVISNNLDGPYIFYCFKDGHFQRLSHDMTAVEISSVRLDIEEITGYYERENNLALINKGIKEVKPDAENEK